MRITNRWHTAEGWDFHIYNKDLWRKLMVSTKNVNLLALLNLKMKQDWLTNDGEGDPVNWKFFNDMRTDYYAWLESGEVVVPETEGKIMDKVWNFTLALYKQDSAYFERIGGVVSVIIVNKTKWENPAKGARIANLAALRKWFKENDKRPRTIDWLIWIFDYTIGKYKKDEFYTKSIDFLINWTLEHKGEWEVHPWFSPKRWYPNGRGQVQCMVHGGKA